MRTACIGSDSNKRMCCCLGCTGLVLHTVKGCTHIVMSIYIYIRKQDKDIPANIMPAKSCLLKLYIRTTRNSNCVEENASSGYAAVSQKHQRAMAVQYVFITHRTE